MYRLAWTYNRLGVPDSALAWALCSWETDPGNGWILGEVLKALCALERYGEVTGYLPWVKGGGVCRYYLARAEIAEKVEGLPSLSWFEHSLSEAEDSTAADAACWLSLLLRDRVPADSITVLLALAVDLAPGDAFYRCRYAELLAEEGRIGEAVDCLLPLRIDRISSQSYWQARAAVAKAEGDPAREVWALRRAWQARRTPDAAEDLGWALYLSGRNSMRDGDLVLATERLIEASGLGETGDPFVARSDSILELIYEFAR